MFDFREQPNKWKLFVIIFRINDHPGWVNYLLYKYTHQEIYQ